MSGSRETPSGYFALKTLFCIVPFDSILKRGYRYSVIVVRGAHIANDLKL